jgi:hypothetical protein
MTRLAWVAVTPFLVVAPLRAQVAPGDEDRPRGLIIGVTGFTGGTWQPSGVEVGLFRPVGQAPGRSLSAMVRLGSFVQDQAVIYGRTTGFFVAGLAGARTPLATLAEVGTGPNPSAVRFVGVVEVGGNLNFNSPLPQGGSMGVAAALVGIAFSSDAGRVDRGFAFLLGPAGFFGRRSTAHFQLSLRYQS